MIEQEEIINDFKVKCEEIITKYSPVTTSNPASLSSMKSYINGIGTDFENINKEITDLANGILNRHSNLPNIDSGKLKDDLFATGKSYFNKYANLSKPK